MPVRCTAARNHLSSSTLRTPSNLHRVQDVWLRLCNRLELGSDGVGQGAQRAGRPQHQEHGYCEPSQAPPCEASLVRSARRLEEKSVIVRVSAFFPSCSLVPLPPLTPPAATRSSMLAEDAIKSAVKNYADKNGIVVTVSKPPAQGQQSTEERASATV